MSIDAGHPGISWTLQFRARIDGALIALHSTDDTGWKLFIRSSALFLEGSTQAMTFALDMEDTASVTDGTWHSLALTATAAGSKIFLDGYQCFSTTADLSPAASGPDAQLSLTPGAGIEIRSFAEHESVLSAEEILALSPPPPPPLQFAAAPPPERRPPLASVQGYAQLARRDIDEASRTQALERISSEGARMASLVEEMLTLAHLDGNRALKRDNVDVIPLILDALSDAHVVAPDHAWELGEASDIQVLGDEAALRQILTNLLANARVHTPAGTRVTVSLSRAPQGVEPEKDAPASSMVRIRVADDGPGIPAEIRDRVFDRFVRGDSSRTRDGHGSSGLGMSIVESLARAMGGSVRLADADKGTVIDVTLPAA